MIYNVFYRSKYCSKGYMRIEAEDKDDAYNAAYDKALTATGLDAELYEDFEIIAVSPTMTNNDNEDDED